MMWWKKNLRRYIYVESTVRSTSTSARTSIEAYGGECQPVRPFNDIVVEGQLIDSIGTHR
jgi:hypothetical protein